MIKWNGKDTQKVWNRDVEADTMQELLEKLREIDVVTFDDVTNFSNENIEGYEEMEPDEQISATETKLAEMSDDDLRFFIEGCNSQAFYQTFEME